MLNKTGLTKLNKKLYSIQLSSQQACISLALRRPVRISSRAHARLTGLTMGAFIMQVVDIGLSEIDAFSVQYARVFKPPGFRLMLDHSSNWPCEKEMDR